MAQGASSEITPGGRCQRVCDRTYHDIRSGGPGAAAVYSGTPPYAIGLGTDAAGDATLIVQETTATTVAAMNGILRLT